MTCGSISGSVLNQAHWHGQRAFLGSFPPNSPCAEMKVQCHPVCSETGGFFHKVF